MLLKVGSSESKFNSEQNDIFFLSNRSSGCEVTPFFKIQLFRVRSTVTYRNFGTVFIRTVITLDWLGTEI